MLTPSDRDPPTGAGDGGLRSGTLPEEPAELLVFTRRGLREVDRLAFEEFGLPTLLLMENAAIHLADVALHLLHDVPRPRVLILCGPGNNGGDGLALARHLHNASVEVLIVLAAEPARYTGDAAANLRVVERMGLPITVAEAAAPGAALARLAAGEGRPDLVVDALLGTGLDQTVREPMLSLIRAVNGLHHEGALVLAVDLPSGLDADTGDPLGDAVEADVTVSFVGLKAGFLTLSAQAYVGEVIIADIGAPKELVARFGTPFEEQSHPDRPGPDREADDPRRDFGDRSGS